MTLPDVPKRIVAHANVAAGLIPLGIRPVGIYVDGPVKDDPSLRATSQKLYDQTKQSYGEMIQRMDSAAASMDPVLSRFKNRVLFVKHNLNAQAIASLKGTEIELGGEIDKLIKEMEASIAEADRFIAETAAKKK